MWRDNVVEKRLRSHLDEASDELALGIIVEGGRDGVETRLEEVAVLEAALFKRMHVNYFGRNKRGVRIPRQEHGRQACFPRQP